MWMVASRVESLGGSLVQCSVYDIGREDRTRSYDISFVEFALIEHEWHARFCIVLATVGLGVEQTASISASLAASKHKSCSRQQLMMPDISSPKQSAAFWHEDAAVQDDVISPIVPPLAPA